MPDAPDGDAALEGAERLVLAGHYDEVTPAEFSAVVWRLGRVALALQEALETLAASTVAWREEADVGSDLALALRRSPEDLAAAARAAATAAGRAYPRSFDALVDPVETTVELGGPRLIVRATADLPYNFAVRAEGEATESERPCTWDGLVPLLAELSGTASPAPPEAEDLAHDINDRLTAVTRGRQTRWPSSRTLGAVSIADGLLDVHRDGARLTPALAAALLSADAQTTDPPGLLTHDEKDWEEPLPRADDAFTERMRDLLVQARAVDGGR